MQFDTEVPGEGTTWGSLDDAVLTSENVLTAAEPVVLATPESGPPTLPTAG
ncbi:hypothetical protein [Streptomyces broussonetiae]|uniref:hypothetical protein n=1 Tax=Streptomyces broussonetiae TaxID=2686304 RepID=UPI001E5A4CD4|nr:hypothetical protein [Streptomyces broussonetiae]